MKNIFKILLGLFLVLFAISCSNDEATEIFSVETQDVVFDINNFIPQEISTKGLLSAKDNEGPHDPDNLIPFCVEGEPYEVDVTIEAPDGAITLYTLKLVTLNNKRETEVVKLPSGTYTVTDFVVRTADGTPLWVAPREGSYYELLWDLRGVDLEFIVPEWDKLRVEIDVLCYQPYQYDLYGFVWFKYVPIEIHTVCFYGDICTKFFEEWHARLEGNPYFNQAFDGYDFPAIFSVKVFYEGSDIPINDLDFNSNAGWYGIGSPLCIEYPDRVDVANEIFDFEIWLAMPDGSDMLIYEGQFDDTAMAEIGNPESFGGTDGVFDFVIGNCSYDGNDVNLELLPWIPIPDSAEMSIEAPGEPLSEELIIATFSNILPMPIPGIIEEGVPYNTLCGEEFVTINPEFDYLVNFYSSMDRELPETNFPMQYMDYPWGSINWLANHCEEVAAVEGWDYVQFALWYLIDPVNSVRGENNPLAQEAALHADFIPTVGDYACVLVKPYAIINEIRALEDPIQLLLLRVDP